MATKTVNYSLTKPAQTDYYDVDVFNKNMDIIDAELKANAGHTHALSSNSITGILPITKGGTGNTSVDTTPTSGSTKMVTSGGVYAAIVNTNKVYVYATDTPNDYKNIKNGLLSSSLRNAISILRANGTSKTAEVILLPGTHNLSTYLSATDTDGFTDLTIRGLSPALRDDCIINYNGTITCIMRFENCEHLLLKDFRTNTSTAYAEAISITGNCKSFVCQNLYLQGGNYGITSSVPYSTLYNAEIGNCIFKKIDINEAVYGLSNVHITALGDNYLGTSGKIAIAKIYGNICLNDGLDFNYTCNCVSEKSRIIEYGNFISNL